VATWLNSRLRPLAADALMALLHGGIHPQLCRVRVSSPRAGGEIAVDQDTMTHIYGAALPAQDVLSGRVPPPPQVCSCLRP